MLGQVYTPADTSPVGSHVWDKNNLAQKNMTIVDAAPDEALLAHFQIGTLHELQAGLYAIELIRPPRGTTLRVALMAGSSAETRKLFHSADDHLDAQPNPSPALATTLRFADHASAELSSPTLSGGPLRLNFAPGSSVDIRDPAMVQAAPVKFKRTARLVETAGKPAQIVFNDGRVAGFPIFLAPRSQLKCSLEVLVPKDAKPGESIKLQLLQRMANGKIGGGITLVINVKARH
jgi:hypothetical protein